MKSVEIGVNPITGIANIMIVNNRPSVWGDLGVALVQQAGQLTGMEQEEIGTAPEPGLELKDWPADYGWRITDTRSLRDTSPSGVHLAESSPSSAAPSRKYHRTPGSTSEGTAQRTTAAAIKAGL